MTTKSNLFLIGALIWALVSCGGGATKKQPDSAGEDGQTTDILTSENNYRETAAVSPIQDDEEDTPAQYYAYALHHVLRTQDEEAVIKNVVLHDIDGCGRLEMIILIEGIPESDDFWGTTTKGFQILIYDAKYRDRGDGKLYFSSDEITYATYKVYVTKKNDIVIYDSFEGEVYQVLRYSKGTLSEEAVLANASGEYFINGVECNEARFLEKLNEYGIADADNVSFMIGKGKMEWEAPFEKEIPEKSSDVDRILEQNWR